MALKKSIEGDTGAVATYWVPIEINLNYYAKVGAIALAGYLSEAAFLAGKRPLDAKQFPLTGADFDLFSTAELAKDGVSPVSVAYAFIKGYAPKEGQPANPFVDAIEK